VKIYFTLLLLLISTFAQAQTRVPRIGILVLDLGRAQSQAIKGVGVELKQLGYSERKNIYFETRNAKGDRSALRAAAKELAAKKVEVLFITGTTAALAAAAATREIPLVFVLPGDPSGLGLVKNSADAARNVTGVAAYAGETTERRLALFKEILPGLTKIYVFFDATAACERIAATRVPRKIGLQFVGWHRSADELKTTLSNLSSEAGVAIFQIATTWSKAKPSSFLPPRGKKSCRRCSTKRLGPSRVPPRPMGRVISRWAATPPGSSIRSSRAKRRRRSRSCRATSSI
jgi:ABC-type uncharacterized transport system substrate-binding protein